MRFVRHEVVLAAIASQVSPSTERPSRRYAITQGLSIAARRTVSVAAQLLGRALALNVALDVFYQAMTWLYYCDVDILRDRQGRGDTPLLIPLPAFGRGPGN